jgi:protease-4
MEINGNISAAVTAAGLDSWLPESLQKQMVKVLEPLEILNTLTDPNGIYLYCDNCPD